ncbi:lmo0937 family membrane protein [Virgibacillus sp. NKC19-16]|nr:lmo0937 family membrane protein [Virgibacillus sp. NKC19-16]UJL45958.1 lmo0937 family membrane protein [Virgibacillus sp. NKC19-16]
MLLTVLIVIVLLWALGINFEIGGDFIHLLIVIALVLLIYRLVTGRRIP